EFCGKTGGAIRVGDRHVHCIESITSFDDGHKHKFRVATLINNPIDSDYYNDNRVRGVSYREYRDYNKDCKACKDDRRY
ncbi:MAG: hypothetical protein K0S55_1966, partial [Clostridia bacterium]|nr:hypothetical protein [Clostridia bacterium]